MHEDPDSSSPLAAPGALSQPEELSPMGEDLGVHSAQHEASDQSDHEFESIGDLPGSPRVVPRKAHTLSRKNIDPDAVKVMGRLIRHGYRAFLVGGGVRDLLLGKAPKDFDIGTDARPEEVRRLFRNSRIIGRRFRLIHVFFSGNKIFEVSTFRRDSEVDDSEELEETSGRRSDNVYGDPLSDAFRRDLTINGLFYDLKTRSLIDYVGGLQDLEQKTIRMIGEPAVRFAEDPVRMIRAVRHSARTGFEIEPVTEAAICASVPLLSEASSARVYEELLREFQGGCSLASVQLLYKLGLLKHLFPAVAEKISEDGMGADVFNTLLRIDTLTRRGEQINAGIIFAALLVTGLSDSYLERLAEDSATGGNQSPDAEPGRAESEGEPAVGEPTELEPFVADEFEPRAAEERESGYEDEGESEEDDDSESGFSGQEFEPPSGTSADERHQIQNLARKIVQEVLAPIGVPRRDREIAEGLLIARSLLVRTIESGGPDSHQSKRRFPEFLPALARITGEERRFSSYFRKASFDRHSDSRPRRRRRRRSPRGNFQQR